MNKEYRWGTMIPLIGGSARGCNMATNSLPLFHLSMEGFQNNDFGIINYWKNIPYHIIDEESFVLEPEIYENIDFVNSVCPCAALCRLNTSTGENVGSYGVQNRWMYLSAEYILEVIKPKVYWGENAPALCGERGKPVVEKLIEIGKKYGYTFSLYKTSTLFHGLPQKRERCFYFFWKGDKTPILNFYDRERLTLKEYLKTINKDLCNLNDYCRPEKPTDFIPFKFLLEKENLSYSEVIHKYGNEHIQSVMGVIYKNGWIDELIKWIKTYHKDAIMTPKTGRTFLDYVEYAKSKFDQGKGLFYLGPVFCENYSPAVISKTCYTLIHPTEDRYISYREYASLMGMPDDFVLNDKNDKLINIELIGQNVPVNAARDMCIEVCRFIDNDDTLNYINNDDTFLYVLQNNINKTIKKVN